MPDIAGFNPRLPCVAESPAVRPDQENDIIPANSGPRSGHRCLCDYDGIKNLKRAFSCFVDTSPILRAQAFIWVNCLKHIQHIPPTAMYVHMPAESSEFSDWLRDEGVKIVESDLFDPRNRYCNKLQQLSTFVKEEFQQVVLMDCDTAWVGNQRIPNGNPVSAKIVDLANPAESVVKSIFHEAGLGDPEWAPVSFPAGEDRACTDWNNCNGGLYIIDGDFLPTLAPKWKSWARWCLDHEDLFGAQKQHADQISFALAMAELQTRVRHLDVSWNYPAHLKNKHRLPDLAPNIIHYHREFTSHMTLKKTGLGTVDETIEALNTAIKGFMRERLVNSMFWDFRYRTDPDLGSGVGSRGDSLAYKRNLLADQLDGLPDTEVVDVGCGDLEVTRNLQLSHYIGLDVSEAALGIAREKRPDWEFRHIRQCGDIPTADYLICLDVLIHQPDERSFLELIDRLAGATRHCLIVSGYDSPPEFTSQLTRYYEPLSAALHRTDAFTKIDQIGKYRDTVVLSAVKRAEYT